MGAAMNVIWTIRFGRLAWWLRLGPVTRWLHKRHVRRALLATPGVDTLVQEVMDHRYGKHEWRVANGVLEALVQTEGQGTPWWGAIGPLRSQNTRKWLANQRLAMRGIEQEAPYKIEPPTPYVGPYDHHYRDTEPFDDDGRTAP